MKLGSSKRSLVARQGRLDAGYFLSPGYQAAERLTLAKAAGVATQVLGGPYGIAKVWAPQRFKRAYAAPGEDHVPYVRPYDIFDYWPQAADRLSVRRTKNLARYRVQEGTILQTCSGRNLGPGVIVDAYLSRFMMSHDLVRIEIDDEALRYYILAFLASPTGQELLRRDKSGSVIDHIAVAHVAAQEIPLFEKRIRLKTAERMKHASSLREEARISLDAALSAYESKLPPVTEGRSAGSGWAVRARSLQGRLDAAFYGPSVTTIRQELLKAGGVPVSDVAVVRKPPGRYKTIYVGRDYGRPILSGSQILQLRPINLRHMAPQAFKSIGDYELHPGWTVYQADGRSEEGLGIPVMVTPDRDGWLASGHVGRLIPGRTTDPGWLFLAARTEHVQIQIKARASGSVVDSTFPDDMADVILPPPLDVDGKGIVSAWEQFAAAQKAEDEAVELVESAFTVISGVSAHTP